MEVQEFHTALLSLLANVKEKHGPNVTVSIRVDDYGVIVSDVITGKILYDADTLPEFTWRYYRGD